MQNRNSYNRDINKRIFLQEDIERLEERTEELQNIRCSLEYDVKTLEESKKELLEKQAIGYEGYDDDIREVQEAFLGELSYASYCLEAYKKKCKEAGVDWESPNRFYDLLDSKDYELWLYIGELEKKVDYIEKVIKEHPKVTIPTDIFLKKCNYNYEGISAWLENLKIDIRKKQEEAEAYKKKKTEELNKQQEALEYKIKQTDALEEVYRKKINDESKVSRMYIFAGFVLGAIFTSLFMM